MKKRYLISIIIIFIISQIAIITYSYKQNVQSIVTDDYIAVFKGEEGEKTYSTYVYQKKKKKTYSYINTVSYSSGYDSSNWTEKTTKKGKLKKKKDIYKIAKKNKAYSYVRYKNGKIYSIEEIKKIIK